MEEDKKRVVSLVLLQRNDPAPEWPVYYQPDSLFQAKQNSIFSLLKAGIMFPVQKR